MSLSRRACRWLLALCMISLAACAGLSPPEEKPFEPRVGQEGKDVIWVPTPHVLVERMLDMARVTPKDFVIDLGSGDGRNVIAAAKRGARALGVEYNPDMVAYSKRAAAKEGVSNKAAFVQGDMFEADISQATVLALFLLTDNLNKLAPRFMALQPGTRIVSNGFEITGWTPVETDTVAGDCGAWCTAYLYLVPAKVAGRWQLPQGELVLEQNVQALSGTLASGGKRWPIADGSLHGDRISFSVNGTQYTGRVKGETMQGDVQGNSRGAWRARRAQP